MSENRRDEVPRRWQREDRIIHRLGPAEVRRFNQANAATEVPQPQVSEAIEVFDVAAKGCHLVLLHHVNRRSPKARRFDALVKLSEQRFAPHRDRELWLRTPAYYRKREGADTKPTDPHDGSLDMNAEPMIRRTLAPTLGPIPIGGVDAKMTFASPEGPWVYCTSIPPTTRTEWRKLMARFPEYDAITVIRDAESFAIHFGIDFAIGVQDSVHVELRAVDKLALWQSRDWVSFREGGQPITKVIWVHHGPVVYATRTNPVHLRP